MFINFINCSGGGGSSSAITEELKGLIERTATSIDIPSGTSTIGENAFYNYKQLTSVTIPDSVTSISKQAFFACSGLTSVSIPESVTSIGDSAFRYSSGLTEVSFSGSGLTSIGSNAFGDCGITSLSIPDSVTSMKGNCFNYCRKLSAVTLPKGITKIESSSFAGCALTSITIHSAVTLLENQVFAFNSGLTTITCYALTAPTLRTNVFQGLPTGGTLYYPSGSDYSSWLSALPAGWSGVSVTNYASMTDFADLVAHDYTFVKKSGTTTTAIGISMTDIGAMWFQPDGGGVEIDGTVYYAQYDSTQDKMVIYNNSTHEPASASEVALFEQYFIITSEHDINGDLYVKTRIVGDLDVERSGWATNPVCGQWTDWYYDKNQTTSLKKATDINELIAASGFTLVSGASINHINSLFENQRNIWVTNGGTSDVYSDTPLGTLHYYFVYDTGATGNVELVSLANNLPLSAEERAAIEDFVQFSAVLKCGVPQVTITYIAALDNWAHFDTNPLVDENTFVNTFVPNN